MAYSYHSAVYLQSFCKLCGLFYPPSLTVHSTDFSHIYPASANPTSHRILLYRPGPPYVLYICTQFSGFERLPGSFGAQGHAPLIVAFTVLLSLIHLHSPDDISFLSPMEYSFVSNFWIVWLKKLHSP